MVLGLIGNIAGNLDQEAFVQGAENESRLQALQRANQQRINEANFLENAKAPEIQPIESVTQGMAGLNLDRFGGNFIEVDPVDNNITGPELDLPNAPGGKPVVVDPDGDGMTQKDGSIKTTPDISIDTPDVSFPDVDQSQIELPKALGGKYNTIRQQEVDRRKNIDGQTAIILKQFGIKRKGGLGTRNVTKDQGDAFKFYSSDEYKNFIYQHPQYLTDVSEDPIAFFKKYTAERGSRTTKIVIDKSTERTDKLLKGRLDAIDNNNILFSKNSGKVVELANDMGIDPIAALAIFGIESDFGRNNKGSTRQAFGSMQVTNAQFNNLKRWFTDPANRAQIEAAYTMGGKVNTAQVDYIISKIANMKRAGARSTPAGSEGEIVAGLAQLIYNKAIGLDKNLWGAGYQANANKVLQAGQPLAVDDGNISNSDYNKSYVTLYNHIYSKYGKQLLDKYGSLSTINLNTIAGSGVGQPILNQSVNTQTTTSSGAANNQAAGQTTTTNNQIAGLQTKDAGTDTDAKSANTGNVGTSSTDVSSLEIQSGLEAATAEEQITVPKNKETVSPPSFYLNDPTKTGFDLRNKLEERQLIINQANANMKYLQERADYLRRFARVGARGGYDQKRYQAIMAQSDGLMAKANDLKIATQLESKKAENEIMYLQGMQGLSDLEKGSTNRAAAVWSEYSGTNIRINTRSDGKYDVTVNGKPYKTYDKAQLSDVLQLAFDQGYRKTKIDLAGERSKALFKAQLEIEVAKFNNQSKEQQERIKGMYELLKEQYKNQQKIEMKFDNGVPYIQRGDKFFIVTIEEEKNLDGDTIEVVREKPVQPPTSSGASSNQYKREKK